MIDSYKLSLVIPMYNVELYIERCLNSCINQNLSPNEYEIIVINDGSKDNSLSIVEKIVQKYTNIHVISQINGGLSSARNTGLKNARGKYIWFIDSDDWIEPNVLKTLYDAASQNDLDILRFAWNIVDEKNQKYSDSSDAIHMPIYNECLSGIEYTKKVLGTVLYVPSFLYRREYLLEHSFFFKQGITYEDVEFNTRIIPPASRVMSIPQICYNYFQRNNSITKHISQKTIEDLSFILTKLIERKRTFSECKNYFDWLIDGFICWGIILCSEGNIETQRLFINVLKKNNIRKIRKVKSLKNKVTSLFFNINPWFALLTIKYLRRSYKFIKYKL